MTAGVSIKQIGMKSMTNIFSNPETIMTEIVWKKRLISCRFDGDLGMCTNFFGDDVGRLLGIKNSNWNWFVSSIYK